MANSLQSDSSRTPEPGELVEVRRRQWLVSSVVPCVPEGDAFRREDLVTLESIEEDAEGEQLEVVWQLDPGARILEKAGLPAIDGHDSSAQLDAFLNAVRWGISTSLERSSLLAPFRSGITIEDYQLDPLVRAVNMARVNLLIADDTGLGKTIEAGLVVQELVIRHRARTVLIVAPAANLTNWQREMREKFGLDFKIIDSDFLRVFRRERGVQANPWTAFPYLIASMDWIKQGEGFRLLKDALPPEITYPRKFDILVVDEAHNVAPSGRGAYAHASLRTRAIRRITPHFSHHLFLSATPHNGYKESFTSLLELLDNQRFSRTVDPLPEQLQRVMVRRLKRDIVDRDGNPVFPVRELLPLEIDYTDDERAIHATLKAFMDARLAAAGSGRDALGTSFVMMLLKKRLFSSPAAFAKTLAKYRQSLSAGHGGRRRADAEDERRSLFDAIRRAKEESADETEVAEAEDEVLEMDGALASPLSVREQQLLDDLSAWAEKSRLREDSKAKAILAWLDARLRGPDGAFNDERVILFTEFMDTHTWLKTILSQHGYGGERLLELHGALDREARDRVIDAFQTKPGPLSPARILLATDSASEGINLHNFCHYLIHVEIPWNPNVMEQRNGRIDRHGQRSKTVSIWHPVGRGFDPNAPVAGRLGDVVADGEYLLRAAQKVDRIREDLGSVGGVLSDQIQNAMLGRSAAFGADADADRRRCERAKRVYAFEKNLRERIARLHENLLTSRADERLSPENVRAAVETALALAGKHALIPASLPDAPPGSVWHVPEFHDSWKAAREGLLHPCTKVLRPITFDPEVARGRDDVVLAHLNHALVRLSLRLLREEIWKAGCAGARLHRVAVRSRAGLAEPTAVVTLRLLLVGGDHLRLHEELTLAGGELRADSFRRAGAIRDLAALRDGSRPYDDVPDGVFAMLRKRFEKSLPNVVAAYETRARERRDSLLNALEKRKVSEIADVNAILDELEKGIRNELDELGRETGAFQLMLPGFSEADDQALKRDAEALKARLDQIPREREKEVAALERHYASPRVMTFPVSVLFVVPEMPFWRN